MDPKGLDPYDVKEVPRTRLQVTDIPIAKYPINSYRFRNAIYGRHAPFDAINEADTWGNNQLNWTNQFLINEFYGPKHKQVVDAILGKEEYNAQTAKEVKDLAKMLDSGLENIKRMIDAMKSQKDFDRIKEELDRHREHDTIRDRLRSVETKVDEILYILKTRSSVCQPTSSSGSPGPPLK